MAFNEQLNDRLREALAHLDNVEEKHMFGGTCYMLNGKMCIGVMKNDLLCRIGPDNYEETMKRKGCHEMAFAGRVMKGYVLISEEGIKSAKDFSYWIKVCLEFNVIAKAAKKKKAK